MDVEKQTREEISNRIGRLQQKYGSFTVHEDTVQNEREYFEDGKESVKEEWIGDAGAWLTDDENRVLLSRHEGSPNEWGTPGGGHHLVATREQKSMHCSREVVSGLLSKRWSKH